MLNSIDQIVLGTAKTIISIAALPTTVAANYQQHTLFKLPSGEVHRLTKPIVNAIPLPADFELLVPAPSAAAFAANLIAGTTFDVTKDYQVFNGNVALNVNNITTIGKEYTFQCNADLRLTLSNATIQNIASSPMFDAAGVYADFRAGDFVRLKKITATKVAVY